jgi:WD40 repeat protein
MKRFDESQVWIKRGKTNRKNNHSLIKGAQSLCVLSFALKLFGGVLEVPRARQQSTVEPRVEYSCTTYAMSRRLVHRYAISDIPSEVFTVRFSNDSTLLATGCNDGNVRVYGTGKGSLGQLWTAARGEPSVFVVVGRSDLPPCLLACLSHFL